MKFIFSYVGKYKWKVALVMFLKFLASFSELFIPYVLEYLIDDVTPTKSVPLILFWGMVMVVLAFAVRFTNVSANRRGAQVAKDCTYAIRKNLFFSTMNLAGSQIDEVGLPSVISRMTSDSYNVQDFIRAVQAMGIRAPILLIGGIIVTLTMDTGLALILCVISPILIGLIIFISIKGIPLYQNVQNKLDNVVRVMRENITGIRVVKALSKEDYERNRFGRSNDDLTGADIKASIVMSMPGPVMTLCLNIGLTLVVYIGAIRVNKGVTEPGVILAFLSYFNMVMMGCMGLSRIFMMMSKANASAGRIESIIKLPDILSPVSEDKAKHTDRDDFIVFDHVDFSYNKFDEEKDKDRTQTLYDIDFAIKKGGSLGIIGATGSGKSTIFNLLMRFYDADKGGIFVDGRDVRTYEKDELHNKFGVVFQNDIILTGNIKENIIFGKDVDDAALDSAIKSSMSYDFISKYDEGADHITTKLGTNLSGGQKQRVLIARALAAHPEILLLDDSSSALDYRTDAELRKALAEHYPDTTLLVVAQRISSIMSLDEIIMIDEGRIIGRGTHEEMLKNCPAYKEIFDTQMGDEN